MRLIGLSDADTTSLLEIKQQQTAEADNRATNQMENAKNMAAPRRKLYRFLKAAITISLLGTVFVFVRVHFFSEENVIQFSFLRPSLYTISDVVKLRLSTSTLSFADSLSGQFLKIQFESKVLKNSPDPDSCKAILGHTDARYAKKLQMGVDPFVRSMCLKWNDTLLVVNDTRARGPRCYSVQWTTPQPSTPESCISLSGSHWYGGSLLREQQWPLGDNSIQMQPFISSPIDIFEAKPTKGYGPVLERMWINSAGFGIVADAEQPLHVSVNAHKRSRLCLKSQYERDSRYKKLNKGDPLSLKFTVCVDRTARHIHEYLVKHFVTLPKSAPSEALMQDPVWSTRGINMMNLTQSQALYLANNISKSSFLYSQIHMAGNYTRTVGGTYFDHNRFPNAHQMVGEMKQNGFTVSTSVLPVLQKGSIDFNEGLKSGVFVNDSEEKPQEMPWGNRTVAMIDFTSPAAASWMTKRLGGFKVEAPVRAFHFDRGEGSLLSSSSQTTVPLADPCDYSTRYVQFANSMGNDSIVSVGYRSQQFPVMVDIGARNSSWGHELGLKSIIPSVLTLGLLGYPFLVVGPVGGVRANKFEYKANRYALPDRELYIRWLQLSVFLPGLEMSVGPWQYDEEVLSISHKLFKRRAQEIFPHLQTAVKEFLHTGAPVIRPVWWMATGDEIAQRIDCEFLISNNVLVAPVLEHGMRYRDVYLPKVKNMKWQDELRGKVYTGGQWLRGFKVDLGEVATFRPVYRNESAYHLHH